MQNNHIPLCVGMRCVVIQNTYIESKFFFIKVKLFYLFKGKVKTYASIDQAVTDLTL